MDNSNRTAFAGMLNGLREIKIQKPLTANALEVYFAVLKPYSWRDVQIAFLKHQEDPDHGSYFPAPADLVRRLKRPDLNCKQVGDLAWSEVMNALERIGPYSTFKTGDKKIVKCIQALGGWKKLCSSSFDQLTWLKKEFIELYETLSGNHSHFMLDKISGVCYLEKLDKNLIENKPSAAKVVPINESRKIGAA